MIVFGLLHIALGSLLAYVLGCVFGQINSLVAILSLLGSLLLSAYLLDYDSIDFLNLRVGSWRQGFVGTLEKIVFAIVIFVGLRHFLFLFYQVDHEFRSLHQFNLGDLPLHIHYIRGLAAGIHFPPVNPNFPSQVLRYPFAIDLYNSLWECLGVPIGGHLFLTGIFCVVAGLVCLRLAGSWLAMVAMFFGGGYVALTRGGPQAVQNYLAWKSLFLAMIITQRGFLFALPVGILLIYFMFLNARREVDNPIHSRTLLIMGILWASLSFFHLHTFFIISIMIFAAQIHRQYLRHKDFATAVNDLKTYFFVWMWPALIGGYFVLYSVNLQQAGGVTHWHWGWTIEPGQNFLYYLSANLGPYLLLFFGVGYYILRFKKSSFYFAYFLNIGLMVLFFNLILAPSNWDNIKLLVWPYLALSILSYEVLRKYWTFWTQLVLLLSLSYGGLYALSGSQFSTNGHISLYELGDIANLKGAVQDIPANAIFASSTTYNHELTALGRIRVMGYDGHLFAHGINYAETQRKLVDLMSGGAHWLDEAHELNANYILWGPKERLEFQKSAREPIWKSQLKNVSRVKDFEVYEVP